MYVQPIGEEDSFPAVLVKTAKDGLIHSLWLDGGPGGTKTSAKTGDTIRRHNVIANIPYSFLFDKILSPKRSVIDL